MDISNLIRRTPNSPQNHDALPVVFQVAAFVTVDMQDFSHRGVPHRFLARWFKLTHGITFRVAGIMASAIVNVKPLATLYTSPGILPPSESSGKRLPPVVLRRGT